MISVYIFIVIFGLFMGSFINVCIYRLPAGKSIVSPPSYCPGCGARLKPFDLIPVFGYMFLRGRCRYCRMPISPRYPAVELLTAAVYTALYAKLGLSPAFAAAGYLMTILLIVFFIDIDHRIIPDELVVAGLCGGAAVFVCNIFYPGVMIFGDGRWWTPLLGMLPGSGVLFAVAILGSIIYKTDDAMGMGDVKLMAPVGMFLGWRLCLAALFISILVAGVSSIMLMLLRIKKRKDTIPFGPFIVMGTFLTIMWGWNLLGLYLKFY